MSKLFIRLTIILVAIYTALCHITALLWQVDLWSHTYTVMFEICVCLCISEQGKYHCKFIRWTAYSLCFADALVSVDAAFDIMPYSILTAIIVALIAAGLLTTTMLAIRHYAMVRKIKKEHDRLVEKTVSQAPKKDTIRRHKDD